MRCKPDNKVSIDLWIDMAHLRIVPGEHGPVPSENEVVWNALARALRLLRSTESGESHAGPGVFMVWADAGLSDNPPERGQPERKPSVDDRYRWFVCPMTWEMMERATYAAVFLALPPTPCDRGGQSARGVDISYK
jgi:hypothetical protein